MGGGEKGRQPPDRHRKTAFARQIEAQVVSSALWALRAVGTLVCATAARMRRLRATSGDWLALPFQGHPMPLEQIGRPTKTNASSAADRLPNRNQRPSDFPSTSLVHQNQFPRTTRMWWAHPQCKHSDLEPAAVQCPRSAGSRGNRAPHASVPKPTVREAQPSGAEPGPPSHPGRVLASSSSASPGGRPAARRWRICATRSPQS